MIRRFCSGQYRSTYSLLLQPGLLLDALTLYKENITAHFEGKEECAIVSAASLLGCRVHS